MIYVLVIGIVIMIISIIAMFNAENKVAAYILGAIGAYFISGAIMWLEIHKHPTAMDVYQGKTTLEITYKDCIPIDSTVVFKTK